MAVVKARDDQEVDKVFCSGNREERTELNYVVKEEPIGFGRSRNSVGLLA